MLKLFEPFTDLSSRTEKTEEQTDLFRIFEIEEEFISEYKRSLHPFSHNQYKQDCYNVISEKLEEKVEAIDLTPKLVTNYISARENSEINSECLIRGIYSGALLERMQQRYPLGSVRIDGRGKKFNYLFYRTKKVKNIIIENIEGDEILSHAGSNNSKIGNIVLKNIKGDKLLEFAGSYNGKVSNIHLENISGDNTLSCAGLEKGKVEYIFAHNILGKYSLSSLAWEEGTAKYISGKNIQGLGFLILVGRNGTISHVAISDSDSDHLLDCAGEKSGNASHITINHAKGKNLLRAIGEHKGVIKNIAMQDISEEELFKDAELYKDTFKNIIYEKDFSKDHVRLFKEIQTLIDRMNSLSLAEQKSAHEEIAKLQITLFNE